MKMRKPRNVLLPALIFLAVLVAMIAANANRAEQPGIDLPDIVIQKAELAPLENGYHPLLLETNQGNVEGRYYLADGAQRGAIFVPGAGGGWGSPANDLYSRLCEELPGEGIACLRVRYRNVDDPLECILDVIAGIHYLESQEINSIALVGHSRGGMIVIYTAAAMPEVRTVVTLATEGVQGELAERLGPRCSILLIHSKNDSVIPYRTSEDLYRMAKEPKRLTLYPGGNHSLDSAAYKVHEDVYEWIVQQLEEQ